MTAIRGAATIRAMSDSERRQQRSRETLEAIRLQLEAVAERLGAVAVWVADEDGILLGGASDDEIDTDALAAYSTLPTKLKTNPGEQMQMIRLMQEMDGYHVHLREFAVDGLPFTMGVATRDMVANEEETRRAITGVVRILAEPQKNS